MGPERKILIRIYHLVSCMALAGQSQNIFSNSPIGSAVASSPSPHGLSSCTATAAQRRDHAGGRAGHNGTGSEVTMHPKKPRAAGLQQERESQREASAEARDGWRLAAQPT
jgi:hypothetical protein